VICYSQWLGWMNVAKDWATNWNRSSMLQFRSSRNDHTRSLRIILDTDPADFVDSRLSFTIELNFVGGRDESRLQDRGEL
jgi:hypothetical protein